MCGFFRNTGLPQSGSSRSVTLGTTQEPASRDD
jgi:hypothetical protein